MKYLLLLCTIIITSFIHAQTDSAELRTSLETLIAFGHRHYEDTTTLNRAGNFIYDEFSKYSNEVYKQPYKVGKRTYFNVIALVGDTSKPRIVIGAHYDVCHEQDGADDNGSGVVGLIAALKNLKDYSGEYCLEFVAYTLEEPPFFRTEHMGSYVHANDLQYRGVEVHGMISLEMIGYFSDEKKSQEYPLGLLKLFYGGKGDYITLVSTFGKGKFTKSFSKRFIKTKRIKTKKFTGPKSMVGLDFSDHLNYWALGMDALMITDTSFYRNKNYHQTTDTIDTLDFNRMAEVVNALVESIAAS